MGMFDDLDEKANELAAKAKAALGNKDEFLAKAKERMDHAIAEAKEELQEFREEATEELGELREKAKEGFQGARERVAEMLDKDCDPPVSKVEVVVDAEAPAAAEPVESPPTT